MRTITGHTYKFEINLNATPNYFTNNTQGGGELSNEYVEGYVKYINHMVSNVLPESAISSIIIYGANPLQYVPQIKHLVSLLDNRERVSISLSINALDLVGNYSTALELWKECGDLFELQLYYNPIEADGEDYTNPSTSTYGVLYSIGRGIGKCSIYVNQNTIHKMDKIFDSYLAIRKEYPSFVCAIKLDGYCIGVDTSFNKDDAIKALSTVREYLDSHPEMSSESFMYFPSYGMMDIRLESCALGNVISTLCMNGAIYPGGDVPFMTDAGISDFIIGTPSTLPESIESSRQKIILTVRGHSPTDTCNLLSRSVTWTDYAMYNTVASDSAVDLHNLLVHYLPTRKTVLY